MRDCPGERAGHTVAQFVCLVDHHRRMLRQHRLLPLRFNRQERVVGDHNVGVRGRVLGAFGKALFEHGARGPQAVKRVHGHQRPCPVGHAGHQVVPVPRRGRIGPLPDPRDLGFGRGH